MLQAGTQTTAGHWRDFAEGLSLIGGSRALLTVLLAWNVGMLANAGVNVAEVKLAKVSFDAGDFGYGLLLASAGCGRAREPARRLGRAPGPAGVYGAGLRSDGDRHRRGRAVAERLGGGACVAVSGAGNGIAVVCNALFVQRGAPDRIRGRVFTVLMSSNYAVLVLGMLAAGPLTDEYGARWVWGVSACLLALAALVGYALARGIDEERAGRGAATVDAA